jgi:glycosyltransferase involved in cell wall biosynthesis
VELRVRFVITGYPPSIGGAQIHTRELVHALNASGHVQPRVSTLWSTSRTDYLLGSTTRLGTGTTSRMDDGIPVDEVKLRRSRWIDRAMALAYLPMRRTASSYFANALDYPRHDADVVHVVRMGREHLAVAAFQDARRRGVPVVLTPLHHPRWSNPRRPDPVWRALYRSADALVALTSVEKGLLVDLGVEESKVTVSAIAPVLADCPDPAAVLADLRLPERYLLFLGQQLPYKRVDLVLDALARLLPEDPDLHVVLAGPPAAATDEAIERRGLAHRVRQLGIVDPPTKTAVLAAAQALVFPSEQEAFGGVLVEAAALGVPFVTSDLPQLVEVRDRLDWGSVSARNAEDMTACVRSLLADLPTPTARSAIRRRTAETFDWAAIAGQHLDVYRGLRA